jgi:hypothetical protein
MLEPWVTQAAQDYMASNPKVGNRAVMVQVSRQESLGVWGEGANLWSAQNHPLVWIPEAGYNLAFAQEMRLNYQAHKASLGQSPVIWGGYQDYATVIVDRFGAVDSNNIQAAAAAERWEAIRGNSRWGFIKLAFSRPDSTGTGLASLFTLLGDLNNGALSEGLLGDTGNFEPLKPIIDSVPNFSTLGFDPGLVLSTRGTSTAELALLPEQQWLSHWGQLTQNESLLLYYPAHYILLDFPYAIWSDGETTADERRAAQAFGDFLLTAPQQQALAESGFRPASGGNLSQYGPFSAAGDQVAPRLSGTALTPPDRASVLALLRWFKTYRTAP